MSIEELNEYYQTSWLAWFCFPATLRNSLSQYASRSRSGSDDRTTPWIDIVDVCQAFESVSPFLRWLFKGSLGRFCDGQTWQRYSLFSPILKNAVSRHLYLYLVFHARQPEPMVALLEQFESRISQYPEAQLTAFTEVLVQADPVFFTDFFSIFQDIYLSNRFTKRYVSAEWIASMQTLHGRQLWEQLPETLRRELIMDHKSSELTHLLVRMQEAGALPPAQSWDDVETILKNLMLNSAKAVERIETLRDEQLLTPENLMAFSKLVKHYPYDPEIAKTFVDFKQNGVIDSQTMRDYLALPVLNQHRRLSKFIPTLTVFHRLGWLDGDDRLNVDCIREFSTYDKTHPVERVIATFNKQRGYSDPVREKFLATTGRIIEPSALCRFFEASRSYFAQIESLETNAYVLNTEPVERLKAWGFDCQVFEKPETLPDSQLSSDEKTQYVLEAFTFLHKITDATHTDLVPVIMQAVINHPTPEQAMMAWVVAHKCLFLWMPPDKSPYYAIKNDWADWITRMLILKNADLVDKLPRLLFENINCIRDVGFHNVTMKSITNMIVALQRINLLDVLLLPNIESIMHHLDISFNFRCQEMTHCFDELHQHDILTPETIFRLSLLFSPFRHTYNSDEHSKKIQHLNRTLITLKQKGILNTASMQELLDYEPFYGARASRIVDYDVLVELEPVLAILYQLGLLDGAGRWAAQNIHNLILSGRHFSDIFESILTCLVSQDRLLYGEETRARYLNAIHRILQLEQYAHGVRITVHDYPGTDRDIKNKLDLYQSLLPADKLPPITLLTGYVRQLDSVVALFQSPQCPHHLTLEIDFAFGEPNQWIYNALSSQKTLPLGLRVSYDSIDEEEQRADQLCERPFLDAIAYLTFLTGIQKKGHKYYGFPLELCSEIFSYVMGWHTTHWTRSVKEAISAVKHRAARDTFFAEKTKHLQLDDMPCYGKQEVEVLPSTRL